MAEEGDLAAIRELADRLDGKPVQVIDRRDAAVEELSDAELHLIASGGLTARRQRKVLLNSSTVKGQGLIDRRPASRRNEVEAIQQPDHLRCLPASTTRSRDLPVVQDSRDAFGRKVDEVVR